ncbi:30S ribosomal protein S6 [Patescibacteria group bacterium]|nr:30S ribosomal protein S6 [Patescibacteria group bacterium]MBU4098662.1 30S ribosomal protein S6 [Patescibacteria group bacterium]
MRSYDLVVVLRPSLKDMERKKLIDGIKTWLKGMKIAKEEEWGQKPLAYTIKKEAAGYYILLKLETDPSSPETIPAGFEQKLLINDSILRHLLLRTK